MGDMQQTVGRQQPYLDDTTRAAFKQRLRGHFALAEGVCAQIPLQAVLTSRDLRTGRTVLALSRLRHTLQSLEAVPVQRARKRASESRQNIECTAGL